MALRERELKRPSNQLAKQGQQVIAADALRGSYAGPVLLNTSNFLAQLDTVSGRAVIHDRLMLEP